MEILKFILLILGYFGVSTISARSYGSTDNVMNHSGANQMAHKNFDNKIPKIYDNHWEVENGRYDHGYNGNHGGHGWHGQHPDHEHYNHHHHHPEYENHHHHYNNHGQYNHHGYW